MLYPTAYNEQQRRLQWSGEVSNGIVSLAALIGLSLWGRKTDSSAWCGGNRDVNTVKNGVIGG